MTQEMDRQDDERFFADRGFGISTGLGQRPCLVVVDMEVGFTDPQYPMGYELGAQIDQTNRLIAAFRTAGLSVVFTTIAYEDEALLARNVWAEKMQGLRTLRGGSSLVELDPRLDRLPADDVIVKHYASAFFGTDLVSRLATDRADTIVVTGCTTSGCVRATVVDAVSYGYRAVVVSDAVGDRSQDSHHQSLFDVRQKYGDVVTTDDLLARFSASPDPVPEVTATGAISH